MDGCGTAYMSYMYVNISERILKSSTVISSFRAFGCCIVLVFLV